MKLLKPLALAILLLLLGAAGASASEADLAIPDLHAGGFFGGRLDAWTLLLCGALVICGTLGISLYLRSQIAKLPVHKSMLDVAEIIFQTCKTYLFQQAKFLLILFCIISLAITYYLVGFGGHAEYEVTDRTLQELRLYPEAEQRIPKEVIDKLEPLRKDRTKFVATEDKTARENYVAGLKTAVNDEAAWTKHGDEITRI